MDTGWNRTALRTRAWVIALVLTMVTAGVLVAQSVERPAQADPLFTPPVTDTATGSYRTGLAKDGLV
jgi:hypothetical protein